MIRYVIFTPADGLIRAVLTGDRGIAEANLRSGEALVEHEGYVSAVEHRVESGQVVSK